MENVSTWCDQSISKSIQSIRTEKDIVVEL